ncbi:response regulator transcription factor [Massilia sp. TN1-12]|uniref:response regulator transcription factor n=1 Tax=Massilia paldalensis TaxID=3377675 RepID=UPI00384B87A0
MNTMKTIHVMHVHPAMSAGLAALLQSKEWLVTLHAEQPESMAGADVVVTDYDTGLELARTSAGRRRGQEVLVVTNRDKEWDVRRALEVCVGGYLLEDTSAAQLQHAVRYVLTGSRYLCPTVVERIRDGLPGDRLTNRESDVLQLLAKGHCNKRIARDLGIEVGTVKWHLRSLMTKLGASARTQAVVLAAQRGLVGIDMPA